MYCPKCGAHLSDDAAKCPLCLTPAPVFSEKEKKSFYPATRPRVKEDFRGLLFFFTLLLFTAGGICFALDLILGGGITFSGYVLTGLLAFYAAFLLPRWWRRPNPVIFFPVTCLFILLILFYIDLTLDGGWFLTFALPTLGGVFLCLEAAVTLTYYLRRGRFYIFGGLFLAFAALSFVGEVLFRVTFSLPFAVTFSILPMIFFFCLGMGLIVIAIVPPFRRYFERRFFL